MFHELNYLIKGIVFIFILISSLSAQQFTLEATLNQSIHWIFDIDGDGICEYFADSNGVYDGSTHQLKYSLPNNIDHLFWQDPTTAQNPYPLFPHIDFNSDGKRDIISYSNSGSVIIYDVVNNQVLFEFDSQEKYTEFEQLIDIDGDGVLEIIIEGVTYNYEGNPDIYKTFIFSTGVTSLALERQPKNQNLGYKLHQNYPNPFNPSTTIEYNLPKRSTVKIKIYNINGQMIKELINEEKNSGHYSLIWDGTDNRGNKVASGTYLYQIQTGNFVEARKMLLLK